MKHLKTYEANFISRLFGGKNIDPSSAGEEAEDPTQKEVILSTKARLDSLIEEIKSIKSDKFELEFSPEFNGGYFFVKYNPSIITKLKNRIKSDVFTLNDIIAKIRISDEDDEDLTIIGEVRFRFNGSKSLDNIKIVDRSIRLASLNGDSLEISVSDSANPDLRVTQYKEENFITGKFKNSDKVLDEIKNMANLERVIQISIGYIERYFKYYDELIEYDKKVGEFTEKEEEIDSILYDLKDLSSDFKKTIYEDRIEYKFKINDLGFKPQRKRESVSIPYGKSYGGSKHVDFTFRNAGFKLTKNLIQVFRCLEELDGRVSDIVECDIDIDISEDYLIVVVANNKNIERPSLVVSKPHGY